MQPSEAAAAFDRGGFRMPSINPTDGALPPSSVELEGPFSHEFIHLRGVRLHIARSGPREAPLILLIHDALGGWFDFAATIEPLARRGWHAVAVDVRGYGMSDKPPATAGNAMHVAVGDITGLIRALGYDAAVLVGVDSGGALAWLTAATQPQAVRALVSLGAGHPADTRRALARAPWRAPGLCARTFLSRLPGITHLPLKAAISCADRTLTRWTSMRFQESGRFPAYRELRRRAVQITAALPGMAQFSRLLTAAVPPGWAGLKVACPVYFLHPPLRRWPGLARRARRRAEGSFIFGSIPGAERLPHIETPEAFTEVLDRWLRAYL